ncbi:hypothetical protein ABS71_10915 [bacterium SCN 62-11]|nr:MAG: hypothetical protein ABS71_10915 [bacterium SCN 62-11]
MSGQFVLVALDVLLVGGLQRLPSGVAEGEAFFLLHALLDDGLALGVGRTAGVVEVLGRLGVGSFGNLMVDLTEVVSALSDAGCHDSEILP